MPFFQLFRNLGGAGGTGCIGEDDGGGWAVAVKDCGCCRSYKWPLNHPGSASGVWNLRSGIACCWGIGSEDFILSCRSRSVSRLCVHQGHFIFSQWSRGKFLIDSESSHFIYTCWKHFSAVTMNFSRNGSALRRQHVWIMLLVLLHGCYSREKSDQS